MTTDLWLVSATGQFVNTTTEENTEEVLNYMLGDFHVTARQVLEQARRFNPGAKVAGLSTTLLLGQFRCINIVFTNLFGKCPELTRPNGVLAYVYNADAPDLSELGIIYYEKEEDGSFLRIA